jgi:hypothetical protein
MTNFKAKVNVCDNVPGGGRLHAAQGLQLGVQQRGWSDGRGAGRRAGVVRALHPAARYSTVQRQPDLLRQVRLAERGQRGRPVRFAERLAKHVWALQRLRGHHAIVCGRSQLFSSEPKPPRSHWKGPVKGSGVATGLDLLSFCELSLINPL